MIIIIVDIKYAQGPEFFDTQAVWRARDIGVKTGGGVNASPPNSTEYYNDVTPKSPVHAHTDSQHNRRLTHAALRIPKE